MLALASVRALLEHGLSGLALLDLPSAIQRGSRDIELLRSHFPAAQILAIPSDVTIEKSVQEAVDTARDSLGPLRILCCFAGSPLCVAAENMTFDEWRKITDVNLTGSWLAAQAVGRYVIPILAPWNRF